MTPDRPTSPPWLWLVTYAARDVPSDNPGATPLSKDQLWKEQLWKEHRAFLADGHRRGVVVLAGDLDDGADELAGFVMLTCVDGESAQEFVLADPAVGRVLSATVRPWHPTLGGDRLPRPGDTGRTVIEESIRRLIVDGVTARDAAAYFRGTYADDVVIHEAPSLPYGGDFHGQEGAMEHAHAFRRTWDDRQPEDQRGLQHRTIATDTEALVLWTLSAAPAGPAESSPVTPAGVSSAQSVGFPVVSHYKFHRGQITESRMYCFDTAAIRAWLARDDASNPSR